jgi:hypothetical protein
MIADDETSRLFLDGPRRWKMAAVAHSDHRIFLPKAK